MSIPETFKKQESATYWSPNEKGDHLQGEITEIKEGDFGKQYVIKQKDGTHITTPSHKMLQSLLGKANVGNTVYIEMTGKELPKVKGHNATTLYEVGLQE